MSSLEDAILEGDLAAVQRIVADGANFSGPIDDKKQTVLHLAAFAGSVPIVEYFLNLKKPDINAADEHGWTALLCAASVGNLNLCALLLKNGADPKIYSDQKTTPLHYLCRKAFDEEMRDLKASQNTKNRPYWDLLETLINKGVDINAQNYLGETPLMQACSRGNESAVQFLLNHKAKVNLTNGKGESALFYSEKAGPSSVIKIMQDAVRESQKKTLITHQNVKLEAYADVVNVMKGPEGIPLRDRSYFFITHHRCFQGSEMVDWLIKNLPIRTREEAVEYAQKLLSSRYIYQVGRKKKFKDADGLYKFSAQEPGEVQEEDKLSQSTDTGQKLGKVGIDDFEQIRVLGKGGFGKVLLVKKKDTGKIYALKMMDKTRILNKPRDFKNLMSEKRILQNDSAFLVHLHWAFQTDTDFYLVMDFVGGGDLYYHWKRVKRFPEKTVQFIAAELTLALSYLHSCGIIYRDLKPQNILLGLDGHICLADFGLSKETQSTEMGIHTACGTPTYSAPEVLDGSPYNKAIDYWSLGIVLFQFLVGKPPFEFDGDFAKLLRSIYTTKIKFPKQFISVNCAAFLDGLLQRDVQKRFDDLEIIKRHPFFKGLEWDKLEVKKFVSPIKVTSETDIVQNFDPKYTQMPVADEKPRKVAPEVPDFSVMFGE
eukprot:TRINITY_DN2910_c0_g1_i1.p1 TRINITY_DN2910_c0_g1~~TRINITY_DN2910_c0_g1_i1.p1  ORF type:complete len:655 (-),score=195.25 TRINITY_DN2910_c0_g1_i1:52-2016(-)